MRSTRSVILGLVVLMGVGIFFWIQHDQKHEALETTKSWCHLANYPEFELAPEIEISGGMFTRTFLIQLTLPPQRIAEWVKDSPGLQKIKPELKNGGQYYRVRDSEAAHCEVVIRGDQVYIETYWS